MHRSERDQSSVCSDCGTEFLPSSQPGFFFGARGSLCWDCALRRGGRYDDTYDRWVEDPSIDDLGPQYD